MSNLYSILSELTPTQQDLIQGELLAKQFLEANFPDLDLREGTGLRDTVIRPVAMAFGLLDRALDSYFSQNQISQITDASSSDIVDGILSNWFLERKVGTRSVINARLFFARQKNVSISSDVFFSTDNILKFQSVSSVSVASTAMAYDSYSNEYYIDLDLTAAAEGDSYNLSSGSLLYFSNFDPYFLRAEINYLKDSSISSETNTQFVDRAKTAISTRNLINVPSIASRLQETFNYINRLVSVGMGDAEMMRDQIKTIFTPENSRALSVLTSTGTSATATLINHGFITGQTVVITGATPSGYNGTYVITNLTSSTFGYTLSGSLGLVTVLPTVQSVTAPVYVHNGGCVDVYSSDVLASSILQLTMDATGKAQLTGPVYKVERSLVSGGASADTIPLYNNRTISGITVSGSTAVATTTTSHPYTIGTTTTITGAVYTQGIDTASTDANKLATIQIQYTSLNTLLVGDTVTVSGVSVPGYNGTFTVVAVTSNTFSYYVSSVLATVSAIPPATIGTAINVGYVNHPYVITAVAGSTFTFSLPRSAGTIAPVVTGTMAVSAPYSFTVTNPNEETLAATLFSNGTNVSVTLFGHGYTPGRKIKVSGASSSVFNGVWTISSVISSNVFTFDLVASYGPVSGTTYVTSVVPRYDYGFSERQVLSVDFGSTNAGGTATLQVGYFDNLTSIQSYLDNATNRVLCGDYLARGFNIFLLDLIVVSYNGAAPSQDTVATITKAYLASLTPGDMFIMSDLLAQLRAGGVLNIQTPLSVKYTLYTRDLITPTTGTVTDVLDPNDRTSVFLLNSVATNSQSIGIGSFVPSVV